MNDEIQSRLVKYLDKLEEVAKSGADLAADQIPGVLHEYVAYCRISHTTGLVIGMLLGVVAVWCVKQLAKEFAKSGSEVRDIGLAVGAACGGFMALALVMTNTEPTIKAWAAPRVLLLEKLNEMRR